MRIFKKILGVLLLLIVAGMVLGPTIIQYGWLAALVVLAVSLIAVGMVVAGVILLED